MDLPENSGKAGGSIAAAVLCYLFRLGVFGASN